MWHACATHYVFFRFYLFHFQCWIFEFLLMYIIQHNIYSNKFAKKNGVEEGEKQERCVIKKRMLQTRKFDFISVVYELRRFNILSHTSFRGSEKSWMKTMDLICTDDVNTIHMRMLLLLTRGTGEKQHQRAATTAVIRCRLPNFCFEYLMNLLCLKCQKRD